MGEFLSSVMSGLSSAGTSIGNFATNLVKDGSWLNNAFSGKNLSDTLGGAAKGFDAYSTFKAGKAEDALKNKAFGLQEQQYNDYTDRLAEDDAKKQKQNDMFADIWNA